MPSAPRQRDVFAAAFSLILLTTGVALMMAGSASAEVRQRISSTSGVPHADVANYRRSPYWRPGMPTGLNEAWAEIAEITSGAEAAESGTAVLVIHGGGWWTGSPEHVRPICDDLEETVGVPCYLGRYTLSMEAPFPQANIDLRERVAYLRNRYGYNQVIAVGVSAGGNLAAWLAAKGNVEGFVSWSAPTDLRTFDWFRPTPGWVVDRFAPTSGLKERASPVWHGVTTPGLIIHSQDEWMPVSMAWDLHAAAPLTDVAILGGDEHAGRYFDRGMPLTREWVAAHA